MTVAPPRSSLLVFQKSFATLEKPWYSGCSLTFLLRGPHQLFLTGRYFNRLCCDLCASVPVFNLQSISYKNVFTIAFPSFSFYFTKSGMPRFHAPAKILYLFLSFLKNSIATTIFLPRSISSSYLSASSYVNWSSVITELCTENKFAWKVT